MTKNTLGFFNTHCVIVAVAQLCVDMGVVFAGLGWRREFDVELLKFQLKKSYTVTVTHTIKKITDYEKNSETTLGL